MTRDFFYLFAFVKGKIPENKLYENSKIIDDVIVDEDNLADSTIIFEFKDFDKMCDHMDISDEQMHDLGAYPNFYYYNSDDESYYYDFKEGYFQFYYYFNDENKKIFDEIYKKLTGLEFDTRNDDKEFANLLYKTFERDTLDIINEFTSFINSAKLDRMKQEIDDDLKKISEEGIVEIDLQDYTIKISAGYLLDVFINNSLIGSSYKAALNKIFYNKFNFSPFYALDYSTEFFDFEAFNRYTNTELNNILEKIEENPDLEDKIKKRDQIFSKFELYVNTKMPSNPKYEVNIMEYKILEDKITFYIKGEKGQKEITTSSENFLNLMYNPTLFELEQIYK